MYMIIMKIRTTDNGDNIMHAIWILCVCVHCDYILLYYGSTAKCINTYMSSKEYHKRILPVSGCYFYYVICTYILAWMLLLYAYCICYHPILHCRTFLYFFLLSPFSYPIDYAREDPTRADLICKTDDRNL